MLMGLFDIVLINGIFNFVAFDQKIDVTLSDIIVN